MQQLTRLAAILSLLVPATGAAQQADNSFAITDNSFLVEEAFNQERGIFQNILFAQRVRGGYNINFTQEWPIGGVRHQLSYTIGWSPSTSFGVNYRYQLTEENGNRLAVSPRISAIITDGPDFGLQVNLPVSKQLGDFYLHGNAGMTWPSPPFEGGQASAAGSVIYRLRPTFNLMVESVYLGSTPDVERSFVISPGFRGGWNVGSKQIIVGAAVPLGLRSTDPATSLITYFSYELPFR